MRRIASYVVLLLAIGCGVGASFITYRLLRERQAMGAGEARPGSQTRMVVVAAVPVTYGTILRAEHLKAVIWPADAPQGAFSRVDAVVGRALIVEAIADEPIFEGKLAPVDSAGGLSAVIPRGKRAVSVRVNEIIGVAGFVLPRTRVDILVSINPQGDKAKAASKLILQNVEVLAAGQKTERDEEGKPQTVNVITVVVDPKEAEKLTLASHEGELQLALRNSLDMESVLTPGAILGPMVQGVAPAPKPEKIASARKSVQEPAFETVEVIRGNQRTVERFK